MKEAFLNGTPLAKLCYSKCFDWLPHGIMPKIHIASGADEQLMALVNRT